MQCEGFRHRGNCIIVIAYFQSLRLCLFLSQFPSRAENLKQSSNNHKVFFCWHQKPSKEHLCESRGFGGPSPQEQRDPAPPLAYGQDCQAGRQAGRQRHGKSLVVARSGGFHECPRRRWLVWEGCGPWLPGSRAPHMAGLGS